MDLGLKGKVALVTGAGRGVGREIALVLAREEVHVAVNYFGSQRGADGVVAECRRFAAAARGWLPEGILGPRGQSRTAGGDAKLGKAMGSDGVGPPGDVLRAHEGG